MARYAAVILNSRRWLIAASTHARRIGPAARGDDEPLRVPLSATERASERSLTPVATVSATESGRLTTASSSSYDGRRDGVIYGVYREGVGRSAPETGHAGR